MKRIILMCLVLVGCSTFQPKQECQNVGLSAKEKKCIRDMEFVMRGVDQHILNDTVVPVEIKVEWIDTKYECWKERAVE